MKLSNMVIYFWQLILTPHIGALASALAELGYDVTFVANQHLSADRAQQGWETPVLGKAKLAMVATQVEVVRFAQEVPSDSIHLCQGLRGNGLVGHAQRILQSKGCSQWVIMETVENAGWLGLLRRIIYRTLFMRWRNHLAGVLAIGRQTPDWVIARGMYSSRVYPIAYFLKEPELDQYFRVASGIDLHNTFRFIFAGQLIERKRVDRLITALAALKQPAVELWIVGNGPEESHLRTLADTMLPGQVRWLGCQLMHAVPDLIKQADCLVLPSRHDGWGAVVSEALLVGTPAICSDACGASIAIQSSGVGGIFTADNHNALIDLLRKQLENGIWLPSQRQKLAEWAWCLGASAGAAYLAQILEHVSGVNDRPIPPWLNQDNY